MFDSYKFIVNEIKNTTHNNPHKLAIFKIEDGLNNLLYRFLSKYHENIDVKVLNIFDNSIMNKTTLDDSTNNEVVVDVKVNKMLQFYDTLKWTEYLKNNKLNYDIILTDELREVLYNFYKEDFITFGYSK